MAEHLRSGQQRERGDEELWSSYVDGDDGALEMLLERCGDELYWYLLLSTGRQRAAAEHFLSVWELVARYRRRFDGFASFRGWLYAVATQNAVPATHPESFGLADMLDDIRRAEATSRRGRVFFGVADLKRAFRQPFLLVTVAGLNISEAAKACNFTEKRTVACVENACRFLARSGLFRAETNANEL